MALRRRRRKLTTTLTNVDRRLRDVERRRAPRQVVPAVASITVDQLADDVPKTAEAIQATIGTIKTVPPAAYKRVIAKEYKTYKSFIKPDKATLTTDIAHEMVVGDKILVSGLNSQFDLTAPGEDRRNAYSKLNYIYWTVTEVISDYTIVFTRPWEGNSTGTVNIDANTVAWNAVTTKAIASNVVTLTIGSGHTFVAGDRINVDGVGEEFDGNYTITSKTSTTVRYKTANNQVDIAATAGDGGVYPTLIKYVQVGDTWSDPTDGALYSWTGLKWEQVNATIDTAGAFIPDDIAPKIPTSLAGAGTAYYDVRDPRARVVLTWVAPTQNVDDTAITDLVGYDIFYRTLVTDDWKFLISVTDLTYTHEGLKQGVALRYAVKAYDKSDNRSDYSAEIFLTTPISVVVVNRPSAPQLTSRLGTVTVRWDGLDYLGNAMGDTFSYIEIHRSLTSGFTPSTSTAIGKLFAAPELYVDADLTYGTTYYYKFIAVNLAGGVTTASTQASVSVNRLVDTDLIANTLSTWPFAGQVVSASAIADGSIDVFKLANGAVNADKILANAVTELKIAANAVSSAMIQVNAVTSSQLGPNAVTQAKISDAAISAAKIGANAVEAGKIAANAVGLGSIAANAVTAATITAGAITAGKIDTGAVTATTIAANAITAGKIDAGAVTATTIAANAIEASKIAAGAIIAGKIAADAITANTIAANAITAAKIVAGTISSTEIAANAIVAGKVAADAIGANQIAAGAIIAGKIGADAITANTIAANAISAGKIQANAIETDKINAGAITGTKISADAIDGKTITGATVRTSASSSRVEMTSSGLFVYSSGTPVVSLNASGSATFTGTITGSTITGGTVTTAASGATVSLDGSNNALKFTNAAGTAVGWILPYSSNGMIFNYGASPGAGFSAFPAIAIGSTSIVLQPSTSTSLVVGTTGVSSTSFTATSITSIGAAYMQDSSTTTFAANARIDVGDGRLRRSTASSIRFKEQITDLANVAELNPSKLLDLPVRAFKFKADYLDPTDARAGVLVPGFIAEEVAQFYPGAADSVNGEVENWNERFLIPGMLALIQDLYKEINAIKGA